MAVNELNLAQLVARRFRERGDRNVKSLYWNIDQGNLTVFARTHTAEKPQSFNYAPPPDMTIGQIADYVSDCCKDLNLAQDNPGLDPEEVP